MALVAVPARASSMDEVPFEDYVRLHVVAEDDSAPAQALKLKVRDAVLEEARRLLEGCGDPETAWEIVNDNRDALERAAGERALAEGYQGSVRARTGVFLFPERRYGDVRVPAGEYRALRVVIGGGAGHNWWCVLYPSLCVPGESAGAGPVAFYSSILRWLEGLLGGDGA